MLIENASVLALFIAYYENAFPVIILKSVTETHGNTH